MELSEEKMIEIIKSHKIGQCNEEEKKQVMNFAFGEDFMKSSNKGER
jgi:hypothetical protein|tara:strand:+ start:1819 stop:1959 length:141 start_codon:yes stop_codon:yes gene_type:complete